MRFALLFLVAVPFFAQGQLLLPVNKEMFVNSVYHTMVDSTFTKYYLSEDAGPCSFVRYDYDEWVKYGLKEDVPIAIMQELSRNCYLDRKPLKWRQAGLVKARLITQQATMVLTDPLASLHKDTTGGGPRQKRIRKKVYDKWAAQRPEDRTAFYFSRPEFTADWRYAVVDMSLRCDHQFCGVGKVCLFQRTDTGGWKLIGEQIRWGN